MAIRVQAPVRRGETEQNIYKHLEEHNDPQNCNLCDVASAIKEAEEFLARLWHLEHPDDPEHCVVCAVERTAKDAGHSATVEEVGQ
jgi:hypothetical protein